MTGYKDRVGVYISIEKYERPRWNFKIDITEKINKGKVKGYSPPQPAKTGVMQTAYVIIYLYDVLNS